jgi:hypothetical protein
MLPEYRSAVAAGMAAIQMGHCGRQAGAEAQDVVNLSGTIVATVPVSAPEKSRQPMR